MDEAHTYFVGDGQWLVHNCPPSDSGGGDGLLDEIIKHIDNHGLPVDGIRLNRQLTPDEMVLLTRRYNLEFGLGRERESIITIGKEGVDVQYNDGPYWLFSGNPNSSYGNWVNIPHNHNGIDIIEIFHTHLTAKNTPSGADLTSLKGRLGQETSGIIPNELPAQIYPFNRMTPPDDTKW